MKPVFPRLVEEVAAAPGAEVLEVPSVEPEEALTLDDAEIAE